MAIQAVQSHPHLRELALPGCYEISLPVHRDERGSLIKTFSASVLGRAGLDNEIREMFYTVSEPGVLRGMHLQAPPFEHVKTIYCLAGRVLDVALDVRVGSPAYGMRAEVQLSADTPSAIYLERGVAHGFYVLEGPAILVYAVSREHEPASDIGVAWGSFGMSWPNRAPTISERDAALPTLRAFESPFTYGET